MRRLRLDAGRAAIASWERDHGAFTEAEIAEARARVRALIESDRNSRDRA